MKKLYNEIENNLKKGLCVAVKRISDNAYCSILNHKDTYGNYRDSGWVGSIKESKQWIGCYCGESKETWNDKDLEIVEVFRPEYEPFKVGDKVRILDSIKKTEDWEHFGEYFLDMTGVINQVDFHIIGTNYYINGCYIGHEFLAPLVEEEVEELTLYERIGTNYRVNGWYVGHEYLAPLVEEQEDNVALEAIKLLEDIKQLLKDNKE